MARGGYKDKESVSEIGGNHSCLRLMMQDERWNIRYEEMMED
jgi:hypothetical protein